jgi:hypothetical protein
VRGERREERREKREERREKREERREKREERREKREERREKRERDHSWKHLSLDMRQAAGRSKWPLEPTRLGWGA